MNFRELAGRGQAQAPKFKAGFLVMADMASSLEAQGLLPRRFEDPLTQVIPTSPTERGGQLLSRESITSTFSAIWTTRKILLENAGIDTVLTFTPCTYTQEELEKLEAQGRRVGYLPPEVSTQEQRCLLGIMFPEMQSHGVKEGNTVTNEVSPSGWFDYEVAIDAPHLNTTEYALRKAMKKEDRLGMNLNQYIVASQDSKVLNGKYLDEVSTWARLLGSRNGGRVVRAEFNGHGYLYVYSDLHPQDRHPRLGGRFVGVPKKA